MTPHDSGPRDRDPHKDDPYARLEAILRRDEHLLKELTTSAEPLTVEQVQAVSPSLAKKAEEIAASGLFWPGEDTCVYPPEDSRILLLYGSESDREFIKPILTEQGRAYNNFFAVIGTEYHEPSEQFAAERFASGHYETISYATKPYVGRAHALVPEFMKALQAAASQVPSPEQWADVMLDGYLDSEMNPQKATLLKASRYAYMLLARLMHREDKRIQTSMLRFPTQEYDPINDPAVELRA